MNDIIDDEIVNLHVRHVEALLRIRHMQAQMAELQRVIDRYSIWVPPQHRISERAPAVTGDRS
jgi:hypothetical protein